MRHTFITPAHVETTPRHVNDVMLVHRVPGEPPTDPEINHTSQTRRPTKTVYKIVRKNKCLSFKVTMFWGGLLCSRNCLIQSIKIRFCCDWQIIPNSRDFLKIEVLLQRRHQDSVPFALWLAHSQNTAFMSWSSLTASTQAVTSAFQWSRRR